MQRIGFIDMSLFTGLALMWGSAFLLIKVALVDFHPIDIVFWRLFIASVVLAFYCWRKRPAWPRDWRSWGLMAALGAVANGLPFCLVSWSETQVDSNFAAILIASVPLWAAMLIPIFVPDEGMTRRRLVGIVIGFVGVIILTGGFTIDSLGQHLPAKLGLMGAALCYAIGVILIRRLRHVPAGVMALGMNAAGGLCVLPVALLAAEPFAGLPGVDAALAVLALGLFSSAAASIALVYLVARVGAGRATVTNYLVPVVATILGVTFLGERLGLDALAGLLFILLGVWISSRAPGRQAARA